MRQFDFSRCCRLAVGLITGLTINAVAQADDTGVVRISDRSAQPVIRAQSPDAVAIEQASCESGACDTSCAPATCQPSCPPHGICGPSHGLVVGRSCDWGNLGDCNLSDCPHCRPGENCPHCGSRGCLFGDGSRCGTGGDKCLDFFANGCDKILGCIHDRLGLDKSGGDGFGVPPIGHYQLTYPVNPSYFDGRDGQVYAAQGYGGPVSVPLAPIVRNTYNYGWGVPSSRLTPISHPIPPRP